MIVVVRVLRGDKALGFWEPDIRIELGDRLVVIRPVAQRSA
jgi:hypothetical protein